MVRNAKDSCNQNLVKVGIFKNMLVGNFSRKPNKYNNAYICRFIFIRLGRLNQNNFLRMFIHPIIMMVLSYTQNYN